MDNSGRLVKMEVDYSSNCDIKIPECKKFASEGKLHDALDQLLALEKLTRTVKYTLHTRVILRGKFIRTYGKSDIF